MRVHDEALRVHVSALEDAISALDAALTRPRAAPTPARPSAAPPAAAASTGVAAAAASPLLVVGIPTIHRAVAADGVGPHATDLYLNRTLTYMLSQAAGGGGSDVPGPFPLQLRVVVMDNSRSGATGTVHSGWMIAKEAWCGAGCASSRLGEHAMHSCAAPGCRVTFLTNGAPRVDDGVDEGSANTPGARVRGQTRDVAALLRAVFELYGGTASAGREVYYMFVEDDFRLCPMAARALAYLIAASSAMNPDWNAARVSYGLNGAIIRMADVPALASYLEQHAARRPPDHLTVEWFAGERPQSAETKRGRPHVAFRYNVLEHFGFTSSLRAATSPTYALCYATMNTDVVFEVEAFKQHLCPADDVWPCPPGAPRVADPQIPFAALAAAAAADSVQTWRS